MLALALASQVVVARVAALRPAHLGAVGLGLACAAQAMQRLALRSASAGLPGECGRQGGGLALNPPNPHTPDRHHPIPQTPNLFHHQQKYKK